MSERKLKKLGSDPDSFVQGGLPDDFDGRIVAAGLQPWDYNGTRENYSLAAFVEIEPDEDSGFEPFTQYYSAGSLKNLFPSPDGEEVVGGDVDFLVACANGEDEIPEDEIENYRGPYCVGFAEGLAKGSNWDDFTTKLQAMGQPGDDDGRHDYMVGGYFHFNRLAQQDRPGLESAGKTLLFVTDVHEPGTGPDGGSGKSAARKSSTKKSTTKASAKKAKSRAAKVEEEVEEVESSPVDDVIEEFIIGFLSENDGEANHSDLVAAIREELGPKGDSHDKSLYPQIVKLTAGKAKAEYLTGFDTFEYDAESGTLTLA